MYKIVDSNKHIYNLYNYQKENEFEKIIVNNHEIIFGAQGIYFDLKKKIGIFKKGAAVFLMGIISILLFIMTRNCIL